jgi:phosphoesterase RecJ-like protein
MLKDILNQEQLKVMQQLMTESRTVVITCHTNADGDAIGSCLGLAEYLKALGQEPVIIVPDQYPDFLLWMPNSEKIIRYDKHTEYADLLLKTADVIYCLDFNVPSRVGAMEQQLVASPAKKVLIDHHLDPGVDAVLTVSHPEACSTCELVFRIVWQLDGFKRLSRQFAVPVYCGMMTDTGGFLYNSSRPEIFFIIGELLTKHIDKDRIYRNVYHNYSEDRIRLMGYVMYEKLVYLPEYHTAFYTITKEEQRRFHFVKGDAEGLVNIPQQIKGLRLSISLREDTEKPRLVWVSLRSVDDFPCNKMASDFFNGGGHLNASGGRLECSLDEAVRITQQAIIAFEDQLK